jgi:hypothetical protein
MVFVKATSAPNADTVAADRARKAAKTAVYQHLQARCADFLRNKMLFLFVSLCALFL